MANPLCVVVESRFAYFQIVHVNLGTQYEFAIAKSYLAVLGLGQKHYSELLTYGKISCRNCTSKDSADSSLPGSKAVETLIKDALGSSLNNLFAAIFSLILT